MFWCGGPLASLQPHDPACARLPSRLEPYQVASEPYARDAPELIIIAFGSDTLMHGRTATQWRNFARFAGETHAGMETGRHPLGGARGCGCLSGRPCNHSDTDQGC